MAEDQRYGAYAPPPDDFDTFDARYGDGARRGVLSLMLAGVLFVVVVALAWNAYSLGVRDREGPPVITAEAGPFRTAPDEPGGLAVEGADLDVFELRDPETEARAVPVQGADTPARPAAEEPAPLALDGAEAAPDTQAQPAVSAPEADTPATPAPSSIEEVLASREPAQDPSADASPAAASPEPEAAPAQPAAEPAPARPQLVESSDGWKVQISAHRSQEEAQAAWREFAASYPDLARDRTPEIMRADLGERGIYFRLRVATAPSRDAANQYCDILKARGQDCLVVQG